MILKYHQQDLGTIVRRRANYMIGNIDPRPLVYDRCDAHLSLISRSPDSSSSLHLSGSPGVCPRYESKEENCYTSYIDIYTTVESNLSSFSSWRRRLLILIEETATYNLESNLSSYFRVVYLNTWYLLFAYVVVSSAYEQAWVYSGGIIFSIIRLFRPN